MSTPENEIKFEPIELDEPIESDQPLELEHTPTNQEVPRPAPVLANATYLLDNTREILKSDEPVAIHSDHIPTDYSSDPTTDQATKLANNLLLDLNLYYEEHLQRELEDKDELRDMARKAVKLIHQKLDFASVDKEKISDYDYSEVDLREEQITTLTAKLEPYYPDGELKKFLDANDWRDEIFKEFLGKYQGAEEQKGYVAGEMKLLKQIKTQLPYFGGSVEYQQVEHDSLEYYIYHISTLTRDPEQQYGSQTPEGMLLPKPMKPYDTNPEGMVPFNNQRNLGTGIVESRFDKLPPALQRDIIKEADEFSGKINEVLVEDYVAAFEKVTGTMSDQETGRTRTRPSMQDIWRNEEARNIFIDEFLMHQNDNLKGKLDEHRGRELNELPEELKTEVERALTEAFEKINESKRAEKFIDLKKKYSNDENIKIEDLWNECNEDEKKQLFGDILRIPWSEAHLHGGHGFEQTTDPDKLDQGVERKRSTSRIGWMIPPLKGPQKGLQNVAGVAANVLEWPEVAGESYLNDEKFTALEERYQLFLKEGKDEDGIFKRFHGQASPPESLHDDFVQKHKAWHDDAMTNAKPQIGGISGHTLGYLNLYLEAREKLLPEEQEEYPSPEQFRAIMLAGLVGTKRHHSYDEVMAASTGTKVEALDYLHKDSYDDALKSEDRLISAAAEKARENALDNYRKEEFTVLKTIKDEWLKPPLDEKTIEEKKEKLNGLVDAYLADLSSGTVFTKEVGMLVGEIKAEREAEMAKGQKVADEQGSVQQRRRGSTRASQVEAEELPQRREHGRRPAVGGDAENPPRRPGSQQRSPLPQRNSGRGRSNSGGLH